jgi:hypothetical protein
MNSKMIPVLVLFACLAGCNPIAPAFHVQCSAAGITEDTPEMRNCVSRHKLAWEAMLIDNPSVYVDPNHRTYVGNAGHTGGSALPIFR